MHERRPSVHGICGLLLFLTAAMAAWAGVPNLPTLTTIQKVRSLKPEQARLGFPVHLRGVVTYFDAVSPDLFLQDATGAVWVKWSPGLPQPETGSVIDLQGVTTCSDFAPDIANPRWTVVGHAPLPVPKRVSYEQMASTAEDSLWVEVEGIVRQAEYLHRMPNERVLWMDLAVQGGRIDVEIPWRGAPLPEGLVDARIRVDGACGAEFTAKDQLIGVELYVPSLKNITVIEAAEPYPFNETTTPIGQLQKFGFHNPAGHRVKLAGVVTASLPGIGFYMKDHSGSLYVETRQGIALQPGDRIETLGFVKLADAHVGLEDAVSRKTGVGPPPIPQRVTAEQANSGVFDSDLAELQATVVGSSSLPHQQILMLQQKEVIFSMSLPHSSRDLPAEGSLVNVTGICVNEMDAIGHITGFRLIARSRDDVQVRKTPPWWTPRHAMNVMGILGAGIAFVITWLIVLRRRVRHQTRVISQKLAQEANLKQAAEMASRAKSEFVANMSHEIRTPMNAILGFTDLLMTTPIDSEQEDYLRTIQFSSQALLRILNDILDFEKIEAGRMTLETIPFSVSECAERALRVIEPETARKRIASSFRVEDGVPDVVSGDPHRLHQVLLNLLGNALKFTERGAIGVTVEVEEKTASSVLFKFTVSDSGIGIPPEAQKRIFESFQQVDGSTTRKYGGTGLGLAICTRLVHLFGGRIWVDSQPGVGSEFHFTARFNIVSGSKLPAVQLKEDRSAAWALAPR